MSDSIKTVKINELPEKDSLIESDILIVEDTTTTHKISAKHLIESIQTSDEITENFVQKSEINIPNGVAPLNGKTQLLSENIPFGTASKTVFEGSRGKALEDGLDAHLLDTSNPHHVTLSQLGVTVSADDINTVENDLTTLINSKITQEVTDRNSAISAHNSSTSAHTDIRNLISNLDTNKSNTNHTHDNSTITSLDASKITSGTIDIERLPKGALERCVVVADDTARFALTTSSVQTGDTVKVTGTGIMYFVVDDSKLSSAAGYEVYTAGSATSVPWSGVTDKPSSYTPSSHTHDYLPLSGGALTGNLTLTETKNILLRPNNVNYTAGIGYDTSGNECIALWAKNSVTRLRWYAGSDMSTMAAGTMMGITPDFEISKASGSTIGYISGNTIIHTGNYASYLPTITGSGASGTWAISITGNAATATTASNLSYFKCTSNSVVALDDTTANAIGYTNGTSAVLGISDGALYKQVYSSSWVHEIYGDYRTGQIAVRGKNNGTWQAWRTILDSSNYTSYCAASSHTHSYAGSSSAGGSATSAVKLATARTISLTGSVTGSGSFDGSGNLSIATTTNHTHSYAGSSSAGGDATNALKLSGYSASSTTTANTIALRTSDGYINATYFNQSSGVETPTTSSYIMYANSDGYLRKSSLANVKTILGLGSAAYTASTAYATSGHTHTTVNGVYTSSGGAQPPSYVGSGKVHFNMMNKLTGLSSLPTYGDFILMDTYSGSDVPYVTAIGVIKTSSPRAYIAVGKKGDTSTWLSQAEIITTSNIGSQSVSSATTATKLGSSTVGGAAKPIYLNAGTATACSSTVGSSAIPVYMNAGTITACSTLSVSTTGNAATATKLATARTIQTNLGSTSSASFNGTANVTPGVTGTLPVTNGGTGATTAANARTNLGLGGAATYSATSSITSGSTALITSGAVYTGLAGKAASSHTHAASNITAGTFSATGVVAATGTDYTTNRIRNTVFTTTDPGAGVSSSYANGSIICVYE